MILIICPLDLEPICLTTGSKVLAKPLRAFFFIEAGLVILNDPKSGRNF